MHYYMRYIKFGLGRCVEDASHEIRDGHISREEGVALAKKYEGEFQRKNYAIFRLSEFKSGSVLGNSRTLGDLNTCGIKVAINGN